MSIEKSFDTTCSKNRSLSTSDSSSRLAISEASLAFMPKPMYFSAVNEKAPRRGSSPRVSFKITAASSMPLASDNWLGAT